MSSFFVPFTAPDEAEAAYRALAKLAGRSQVPLQQDRVQSILFTHC